MSKVVAHGLLLVVVLGGGGTPLPVLLLALTLATVGVGVELRRRSPRIGLVALGLVALLVYQASTLIPLPLSILQAIAPANADVWLEAFAATGLVRDRAPLTLAPGDTSLALGRLALATQVAIYFALLAARSEGRRTLFSALVVTAIGLVGVVLVHAPLPKDAILGLIPAVGRGMSRVLGPFVNSNDLAVASTALVPIALVGLLDDRRLIRAGGVVLGGALSVIALLTVARSSILGLGVGVTVTTAMMMMQGSVGRRVLGAVVLGGLAAFAAAVFVEPRIRGLLDLEGLLEFRARERVWSIAWLMAREHWSTGVGARAFAPTWYAFRDVASSVRSQDAEGLIPQLFATLGIPVTLLLVAGGLGAVARAVAKVSRAGGDEGGRLAAAALGGGLALGAISMVTLTTSQPGIAVLALGLLYAAASPARVRLPQGLVAAIAAGVFILGVWSAVRGERDDLKATDARFSAALLGESEVDSLELALLHPSDPYGYTWAAILHRTQDIPRAMALVNRGFALDPHGAEPHRAAAAVLLAAGLGAQAEGEVRRALGVATSVERSRFVRDALTLFREREHQLALLPESPSLAVEVAADLARLEPKLGLEPFRVLVRRRPPPDDAVAELLRRGGRAEAGLVEEHSRGEQPPRLRLHRGEALFLLGRREEAVRVLAPLLELPEDALEDRWRARALELLGRDALAQPDGDVAQLLEFPSRGGRSEEALRSWLEGELYLSRGQRARGMRALARAVELRPDLPFLAQRLAREREAQR